MRREKTKEINPAQKLQLDRLRLGSFNNMDGDLVADSLVENYDLWDSCMFGRFGYSDLIELRDLPEGHLNADTLIILTDKARWEKLEKIIGTWHADEIGYTGADDETWGTAPFKDAHEASGAMGGGFYMEDEDGSIYREALKGSPLGVKGPRVKKQKPAPSKVPIVVRVWWD